MQENVIAVVLFGFVFDIMRVETEGEEKGEKVSPNSL